MIPSLAHGASSLGEILFWMMDPAFPDAAQPSHDRGIGGSVSKHQASTGKGKSTLPGRDEGVRAAPKRKWHVSWAWNYK